MHTTSTHLLTAAFGPALTRSTCTPPTFLLPSLLVQSKASFSSTPTPPARKDGNPRRGVSALHRKGPKKIERLNELLSRIPGARVPSELQARDHRIPQPNGLRHLPPATKRARLNAAIASALPQPVLDPAARSAVAVDPDHGLWDFFNAERSPLSTPYELDTHGRAWQVKELRNKDWEDLWRLWWVCCKERNRLESFRLEKARVEGRSGFMYGDHEVEERIEAVNKTMKAIKHALSERWYAWENARQAAMEDEEVNLYADSEKGEAAYVPKEVVFDETLAGEPESSYPPPPGPSSRPEARV